MRTSWDELWMFINPQNDEFLDQLDKIVESSTDEYTGIILKNAPQGIKDRYNKSDLPIYESSSHKLSEEERQQIYKSLGITEDSIRFFSASGQHKSHSHSYMNTHVTYRIISSLFGWLFGGFRGGLRR